MKSTELRLNNLVKIDRELFDQLSEDEQINHNNNIWKVMAISEEDIEIYCELENIYETHDITVIEPIQLTEEILLKCGFMKINTTWFMFGNFCINISFDIEWGGNWMGIRLKSLHQLQNLYFTLTNKELEIQL